jgi:hypothetical protein
MMNKKSLLLGLSTFALLACYSPEPFEAESLDDDSKKQTSSEMGTIYSINGSEQICNPSISQDTVKFPASMLWLNFSKIKVNSHDDGFSVTDVKQHDRLTISDTANNVKWYLMIDKDKGECQFQDPEWSTHPDFVVALRGVGIEGNGTCGDVLDYGIFAARTSDKKKFWFYDKGIIEQATPHVWVDPTAKADKDGDASTVEGFFGTKNVRLTYADGSDGDPQNIVFIDYANGGKSKAIKLKKPADRSNWKIESPMISPDGNFVVYNVMTKSEDTWEAYIQELSKDAEAVKIPRTKDMKSDPAQPHWFESDGRLFVVWTEFTQATYYNKIHLDNSAAQDGSAGRTVMREVRLKAGATGSQLVEWVDDNVELAPVPMIGGRSPDGKFLSTGYKYAYLLKLP